MLMMESWIHLILSLSLITFSDTVPAKGEQVASMSELKINFDDLAPGVLPPSWKIDATHPRGKLAEWKVVVDEQAPSKPNVLTITKINDTSSGVFNLCWTSATPFQEA